MYRKEEKNIKDILYILEHLREEDKHEAMIQSGENYVWDCLKNIMENKGDVIIGCKKSDNTPVCVGGCAEQTKDVGIVWLLCTPEISNYQTCILRNLKKEFSKYEKKYLLIFNMLYKENKLAKKWLKKFGFKFDNLFNAKLPDGFEFFYKKKELRGLNNAASTTIS